MKLFGVDVDDDFLDEMVKDWDKEQEFNKRWANRLWLNKTPEQRKELAKKIRAKYDSDSYRDMWFKRGIEPPETLYWTLLDFAKLNNYENQAERVAQMFTTEVYNVNGIVVERMDGQGSVCHVYESIDEYNNKIKRLHDMYEPDKHIEYII